MSRRFDSAASDQFAAAAWAIACSASWRLKRVWLAALAAFDSISGKVKRVSFRAWAAKRPRSLPEREIPPHDDDAEDPEQAELPDPARVAPQGHARRAH